MGVDCYHGIRGITTGKLIILTYFLLTNLYPEVPSSIEYVVWVWTVTMALEELGQVNLLSKLISCSLTCTL